MSTFLKTVRKDFALTKIRDTFFKVGLTATPSNLNYNRFVALRKIILIGVDQSPSIDLWFFLLASYIVIFF